MKDRLMEALKEHHAEQQEFNDGLAGVVAVKTTAILMLDLEDRNVVGLVLPNCSDSLAYQSRPLNYARTLRLLDDQRPHEATYLVASDNVFWECLAPDSVVEMARDLFDTYGGWATALAYSIPGDPSYDPRLDPD